MASELEEKMREEIDNYKMRMTELGSLFCSIQVPTNKSTKKGEGHALMKTETRKGKNKTETSRGLGILGNRWIGKNLTLQSSES